MQFVDDSWRHRGQRVAAGLLTATLAAGGLAGVLAAAGDTNGASALCGAACVLGLGLVANLGALVLGSALIAPSSSTSSAPLPSPQLPTLRPTDAH